MLKISGWGVPQEAQDKIQQDQRMTAIREAIQSLGFLQDPSLQGVITQLQQLLQPPAPITPV